MPSDVGSQLVTNFANLAHEGLLGYVLIPIKPSLYTLFKFLSCTENAELSAEDVTKLIEQSQKFIEVAEEKLV